MKHIILAAIAAVITAFYAMFKARPIRLSNEAQPDSLIGLANVISLADGEKEWLKVPYGNHDHSRGLQIFDKEAAVAMANAFNSTTQKIIRWATASRGGAPIYIGHPDDPAFSNVYRDKRARGWVKELRADEDGLAMRVKWNTLGEEAISNEEFRFFSPRWDCAPVTGKARQFRPVGLVSVGLTNEPNIPVAPIANEDGMTAPLPDWLAEALGVPVDADKEAVLAAIAAKVDGAKAVTEQELADAKAVAEKADADKKKVEIELENERTAHRALVLSNAVKSGRIAAAQSAEWEEKLKTDFVTTSNELEKKSVTLSNSAKTAALGKQNAENNPPALATLANEYARKNNVTFDVAWRAVSKAAK